MRKPKNSAKQTTQSPQMSKIHARTRTKVQ